MQEAHFHQIPEHLCRCLQTATRSLRVAVCWFTRRDVFEIILERLGTGVRVELVMEYDDRNFHENGLDFKRFIRSGGQLFAYQEAGLMHHKFALIDEKLLLNGSFNWTNNSNAENLCITDDPNLLRQFSQAFDDLKARARRIFTIKSEEIRRFSAFPLFENTRFDLTDLRKKISSGACIWLLDADNLYGTRMEDFIQHHFLPFDSEQWLKAYWIACPSWNETYAEERLTELIAEIRPAQWRALRIWCFRMKTGDLIAAVRKDGSLIRIGIVQSLPQALTDGRESSFRDVQWLKASENSHLNVIRQSARISKYKGSALQLIQEYFSPSRG